ncbi:MAG: GAF domain-containing protein [bacterium]|nr:GAF domain-containing protein [bacterium]
MPMRKDTTRPAGPQADPTIESWRFFASLHESLRTPDVLKAAGEWMRRRFGFGGVDIHLNHPESGTLRLAGRFGLSQDFIRESDLTPEHGPEGRIARDGSPLVLARYPEHPGSEAEPAGPDQPAAYAGVPITDRGRTVGVLSCHMDRVRPFGEPERVLLGEVGRQLGLALRNAAEHEQAEQKAHRYIAMSRVITATRHLGTLDSTLQDIAKVLVQALGFDQAWIGLMDVKAATIRGRAGFGAGMTPRCVDVAFTLELPMANPALEASLAQKPVICADPDGGGDASTDAAFRQWMKRTRSSNWAFAPILSGGDTLGVIGVFYLGDGVFAEEDVRTLVMVAEQAANAVENAQLYEQIKTSEERYRNLFEAGGISFAILDDQNKFKQVNRAFETLSGYDREEIVGQMSIFQFFSGKSQLPLLYAGNAGAWDQNREFLFEDRNGRQHHVHLTTDPIPGTTDLLVSLIDMTRERELERRLFKSEELAAIGELSAGIAHEIRNPLVAITTSASLLKDETGLSHEGRQILDVVKEETDHLAAIVDDFLKFARPKKPAIQKEDLNRLVRDIVKRNREPSRPGIDWVEEYDPAVTEVPVDRHQLQQVLTNLIQNGMDAMPSGGTLAVRTTLCGAEAGADACACVSVSDTGTGVPEPEREKIFQPFYSTKEKGTGMGLAICRRIIQEHDGEIILRSEVDRGSAFIVRLRLTPKTV